MNSLEELYGYDANFVDEVLDYLKCVVCHLVMRQPVQIMTCGHRFCKPCFKRIQSYSRHLNTQLLCPIDRDAIDINKVFDDTAVSRDIGNLQVTCSYVALGCTWKGDLRNLMVHEKECVHKPDENLHPMSSSSVNGGNDATLVKELLQRVQNCENTLTEKEKDFAHVKYDVHELKRKFDEREEEMSTLKTLNFKLQNEMLETQKLNQDLITKNDALETKLNTLEKQFNDCEIILKDRNDVFDMKVDTIETKINENKTLIGKHKELMASKKQLENLKTNLNNKITASCNDKGYNIKTKKEAVSSKNDASSKNPVNKSQNKDLDEIVKLTYRMDEFEKVFKTFRKDSISHVENIENILFCHQAYEDKEVKFKWVLSNYQHHYDSGAVVFSPMFYTQLKGYCFKLYIRWTGDDREHLGLYLLICQSRTIPEGLDPFRIEYELEIRHKDGSSKSHAITFTDLDKHKDTCFTIYPNMQVATNGLGPPSMLSMPTSLDYVINDMMFISCTFKTTLIE